MPAVTNWLLTTSQIPNNPALIVCHLSLDLAATTQTACSGSKTKKMPRNAAFFNGPVNYFTATGLPNSTQLLPSNFTNCMVWNKAKSVGEELANTPGKAIGT